MKKIVLNLFFILLTIDCINAQSAGIRTNGANINIASGTYLIIPGDIKISGSSDYISNNGNCYIAGNVINGGNSFDDITATGTEIFNGNTIISGNISVFNNFTIQPSAAVSLSSSINIYNNWTNSGSFNHGNKTVTFRGTTNQIITGNTKFFDLTENQGSGANLIYAATQTTIDRNLTVSAGTMTPNNTLIEFTGAGNLAGGLNKTFYDLQIDNTSAMTITSGGVDINHNFVNNGTYTYSGVPPKLTTFSGSGIIQSFSGLSSSTTTFETVVVGDNHPLSNAITLNCSVDYTVQGGSLSLSHSSTLNNTNNTAIFSNTTPSSIKGSGIANFNNLTTNVQLSLNTGTTTTVSNNLLFNAGGSIATNSPVYGSSATLIYNTTNTALPTGLEWNAPGTTPGLGIPENVTIQNTNNIILPADRGVGGTLNTLSGDALNLNNHTLTVNGAFTGTGALTGSHTSGLIVGSSGNAGTVYFTSGTSPNVYTSNYLQNLKLNSGSLLLGDSLNITGGTGGTYGSTSGKVMADGILTTGGYLTLKSNQYGDATVDNSAGSISGNSVVERYVPATRAWRFLAIPTNSTQTIKAAWQEGGQNLLITDHIDPKSGYGTEITYDNLQAHGYDQNLTYNPSIKVWDPIANDWAATVPYTINPISNFAAYCLFVRGNRDIDLTLGIGAGSDNTTLRTLGGLNVGNVSKPYLMQAGNGVLVSNPYASPIDILTVTAANKSNVVDKQFAVWQPGTLGSYNVGMYHYYNNGYTSPEPGSYIGDTYAQSGQAFMLTAKSNGTTNIDFTESCKVSAGEKAVFSKIVKPGDVQIHPAVYADLMSPSGDSLILVDGVTGGFDNRFSADADQADAQKFANFDENMVLVRNGSFLAIELRPVPVISDTLFYKLYLRMQPYVLKIFSQDFTNILSQAWLVDKYLNTKTNVNLSDTTLYSFTPNTDTNSYRNRFMLVFKRTLKATPDATTMSSGGATANTLSGFVSIYPNPATTGGKVLLKFHNIRAGRYEVSVSSLDGKSLTSNVIQHKGGNDNYDLQLDARWASGDYLVKVSGEKSYSATTKLVIVK